MSRRFICPDCESEVVVKFLQIGETAKCPSCEAEVVVPESAEETDKPPETPKYIRLIEQEKYDDAELALKTALEEDPEEEELIYWLMFVYVEKGMFLEAQELRAGIEACDCRGIDKAIAEWNREQLYYVRDLEDQDELEEIAKSRRRYSQRTAAIAKIENCAVLKDIALHDGEAQVRRAAVKRIEDQQTLVQIVSNDEDEKVVEEAAKKVTDPNRLRELLSNPKLADLRAALLAKLPAKLLSKDERNEKDLFARKARINKKSASPDAWGEELSAWLDKQTNKDRFKEFNCPQCGTSIHIDPPPRKCKKCSFKFGTEPKAVSGLKKVGFWIVTSVLLLALLNAPKFIWSEFLVYGGTRPPMWLVMFLLVAGVSALSYAGREYFGVARRLGLVGGIKNRGYTHIARALGRSDRADSDEQACNLHKRALARISPSSKRSTEVIDAAYAFYQKHETAEDPYLPGLEGLRNLLLYAQSVKYVSGPEMGPWREQAFVDGNSVSDDSILESVVQKCNDQIILLTLLELDKGATDYRSLAKKVGRRSPELARVLWSDYNADV